VLSLVLSLVLSFVPMAYTMTYVDDRGVGVNGRRGDADVDGVVGGGS